MRTKCLAGILLAVVAAPLTLPGAPRVGVLLMDRDLFWAAVGRGAEDAGRASGAEVILKAPTQANALSQQLQLLAAFEGERLDALVLGPLTTEEFRQPISRLKAKGVKVVVLERPLPEGLGNVFLGYNQAEMAATAVKLFAGMVQDGDEAAMLRANSLERVTVRERTLMNDFKKLRPKSVLHAEIMVGATKGDDFEQCLRLLTAHPNIKAVCTPFSACSMAMIKALRERHLAGKMGHLAFGSGLPPEAEQALAGGAMQAWIAQRPWSFGFKGVQAAVDLVNGKTLPATVDVDYMVVTRENLTSPETQALKN